VAEVPGRVGPVRGPGRGRLPEQAK